MEQKYYEIWKWLRDNKLSLEVLSSYDNKYQLRLRNQYGHVLINDSGTIKNEYGEGNTFNKAFNNLIKLYADKIIFNQIYEDNKLIKNEYHFPNFNLEVE